MAMPTDLEEDRALLGRYAEHGDQAAFAALVERYHGQVMGVCRRLLEHADAEDCAQAVFLVLATKAASLRSQVRLGGWLHRTATHIALRQRMERAARRRREAVVALAREDVVDDGDRTTDRAVQLRGCIDRAIEQLPAREREPIILHHLDGIGVAELATRLGLTPEALSMRLMRGRRRLQRLLARAGLGAEALELGLIVPSVPSPAPGHADALAAAAHRFAQQPDGSGAAAALARRHLAPGIGRLGTVGTLAAAMLLLIVGAALAPWPGRAMPAPSGPTAAGHPALASAAPVAALSPSVAPASDPRPRAAAPSAPEPEYLQIGERDRSSRDDHGQFTIKVIEYADHADHHLAAWATAPEAVLDTIVSLSSQHATIATIADEFSTLRQLPIRPATAAIGDIEVPAATASERPLRAVLDQVCAASGLAWGVVGGAVVIEPTPPPPHGNN